MADGDRTIKILHKSYLPGVGMNSSGDPVNSKQRVIALIDGTYNTGGLNPVLPKDLGLATVDMITLKVTLPVPTALAPATAAYVDSSGVIIINTNESTQAQHTDSAACQVVVEAIGDSATAPELLA